MIANALTMAGNYSCLTTQAIKAPGDDCVSRDAREQLFEHAQQCRKIIDAAAHTLEAHASHLQVAATMYSDTETDNAITILPEPN
ncbi:hypothetical protein ABH37_17500 [Mycobacterium haemophilum]|nr:hypothetical protein ABH39_16955 [Mycobacterium haemophilum]KLO39863.1 hypothetical protein ABH37_17500 [Mycobacterium haemophilum]KLO46903.1 hypothetical protein ABH36_17610 [Mycobacterium haemophilum]